MDFFQLFGTVVVETKEAIDALKNTADEAEKTGKSAKEVGDGFSDASKKSKDSGSTILNAFKSVAKAGAVVVSSIVAIGAAMAELAESTREHRAEMGKLDAAFKASGHSASVASKTYKELYSIIGETDQAVEAAQQISLLANSAEDAAQWADLAAGVVGRFGDALQPETFYEAANETFSLNEATGAYVQMLEGCQMSVEEFNAGLQACTTAEEKQAYMLSVTKKALGDAGAAYKKNNKDIIDATSAQEKMTAATARWGEIVEPIVTKFKLALADIINLAADAVDPTTALLGTLDTSEQAAEKVAELKDKIAELNETPVHLWTQQMHNQHRTLQIALTEAETKYDELTEAERKAADGASEAATKTAEATEQFSTITDQYVSDAQALFERFAETYDGLYNKVASFFDPFEKAKTTVRTSVYDMMSAMQSQIDFNNTYNANLQALKEYGLGSLADAFQSYGTEGAAYAKAIVDAVTKAGGATTERGQEIIQGFTDINQQVTESEEELAQTMALMNGEFETELQDMNDAYGAAIDALDKSAEANTAAIDTFQGFLDGMNAKFPEIKNQMTNFGKQITDALQKGINSVSIPIKFQGNAPELDVGMDYVPYDNFPAYLHKGEAVLTAEEAAAWRAGKGVATSDNNRNPASGGGVTVNQYIEAVPQTPVELASATAAYFEQARWVT